MKATTNCLPCFVRQGLRAARVAGMEEADLEPLARCMLVALAEGDWEKMVQGKMAGKADEGKVPDPAKPVDDKTIKTLTEAEKKEYNDKLTALLKQREEEKLTQAEYDTAVEDLQKEYPEVWENLFENVNLLHDFLMKQWEKRIMKREEAGFNINHA